MNTFQIKIDTVRSQGLKYQIYTKESIQDPELTTVKETLKSIVAKGELITSNIMEQVLN